MSHLLPELYSHHPGDSINIYGAMEDTNKMHQWVMGKMAMSEVLIIRYLQLITSRNFDELFWSGVSICIPIKKVQSIIIICIS